MDLCCHCLNIVTPCFEDPSRMSTCCRRCANQFIFFSLGVTLFILSLLSERNFDDSFYNYNLLLENWRSDPIMSIRVATQCYPDEKNMIQYEWPGTMGACDCRGYNHQTSDPSSSFEPSDTIYTNHVCNSTQFFYDCHTIDPISPVEFDYFPTPNTSKLFQLCAITQSNNSFALMTAGECGPNQIQCGSDPNQSYCSNSKICPITSIGFGTPTHENAEIQDFLWVMRNQSKLPLVEFRVAEGGVCLDNHERAITQGREDYFLMKVKRTDCTRDPRFTPLEFVPEPAYYQSNDYVWLTSRLPNFQLFTDYSWGLYSRGYIPWSKSCRGLIMQKLISAEGNFEDILLCQRNLFIASSVLFGVISLIIITSSIGNVIGYDWMCIPNVGTRKSDIIFGFQVFCKLSLHLALAYLIGSSWQIAKTQMNLLDSVQAIKCSDDITMSTIRDINDQLQGKVYSYNLAYLIIFIVSTILHIIVASTYLRKRAQQHQNLSKTQKSNELEVNGNIIKPHAYNMYQIAGPTPIPSYNSSPFPNHQDNRQTQQQKYEICDHNKQND